jgi:hypothetical protein
MQLRSIAALALLAAFSFPLAAGAATTTTTTTKKMMKPKKVVNSKVPGSPGYTNSSPLGSAQKAKKKAAKKAAKTSTM